MNPDKSGDDTASTPAPVTDYNLETAELITRVRHEINNPLAALLGQVSSQPRSKWPRSSAVRIVIIAPGAQASCLQI